MRLRRSALAALLLAVVGLGLAGAEPLAGAIAVTTPDGKTRLDVALPASTPPKAGFPTIVIVPGLECLPENYTEVTSLLTSRGFAVALLEDDGNKDLAAAAWEKHLAGVLDLALAESQKSGKLSGKLDRKRLGIVGHSLGGAVAALAAAHDPRYRALALFGPSARDLDFLEEAKTIRAATLAVDGSLDRIAPPDERSAVVLARAQTPFTSHIIIKEGNHPNCPADFDADYIRDAGQLVMKPIPFWPFFTWTYDFPIVPGVKPMPGPAQRKIAFPYLVAWLERFVAGRADKAGWTTGKKAQAALEAGVLTKAFTSDGAKKTSPGAAALIPH